MFVMLSTIIALVCLIGLYLYAKQRDRHYDRKYQLIVLLRELIELIRQHRHLTHQQLSNVAKPHTERRIQLTEAKLHDCSHLILRVASIDNKPMYRILQRRIESLSAEWALTTVARNQVQHGTLVRHILYLMDEVILAWLAQAEQDDLYNRYHKGWHCVLDSVDALTQLRLSIQTLDVPGGQDRFLHFSGVLQTKLSQLAAISPFSGSVAAMSPTLAQLDHLSPSQLKPQCSDELYQLSSEISLKIFHSYDALISDTVEQIYRPLPSVDLGKIHTTSLDKR